MVKSLTKLSNLFSAVTNGKFVSSATAPAIFTSNLDEGCTLNTVTAIKIQTKNWTEFYAIDDISELVCYEAWRF